MPAIQPGARDGLALVTDGLTAFAARVAAARAATASLDLQYYIWHGDLTGRLLAREVLRAADRGVRVRLLLDDMYAIGAERVHAAMDSHPSVQVRLFNATRWRRFGPPGLVLEMLFGGRHLNRRMHNKAWIADGRVAICGGRNIGDEYFDAHGDINFRDLDLTIVGAAAGGAQAVFDRFWAHPLARPVSVVSRNAYRRGAQRRLKRRLEQAWASPRAKPYFDRLATAPEVSRMLAGDPASLVVPAAPDAVRVVADPPEKATGDAPAAACLATSIHAALEAARQEALVISPYFVPGAGGAALLEGLARRGVRVSVITNSLAATDVVAVHGGYARYRDRLLAAGIALHELKPTGDESASVFGSRGASLHTKALAIDGRLAFVGSFNLDPRSVGLNTEMGTFVADEELARQLRDEHDRLAEPARSWRLQRGEDGRLRWIGSVAGREITLHREPEASFSRWLVAWIVRWLPVESQL